MDLLLNARIKFAEELLKKGEVEKCFCVCEEILSEIKSLDNQVISSARINSFTNRLKSIKRKLNSIMVEKVRNSKT